MNVLILGSGGREHALAWRLSKDSSCSKVFVWPGNDGMEDSKIHPIADAFSRENFSQFITDKNIELVIPGAEKFLYEGVSDWCAEEKVLCFGPSASASELERSKLFSKKLMKNAGVPTSAFIDLTESFGRNLSEAVENIQSFKRPVIKISGPALGKGVFVCDHPEEAADILRKLKENPIQGLEEGLLVEEGVTGEEVSLFFACNGLNFSYLGSAQDHKRLLDNDKGPNTGGMGAVSPVPWADQTFIERVTAAILKPTLNAMKEQGTLFKGVLFLGLMVDGEDMNLLEYNTRFGDPETQALLPLIEGDFTKFLFDFCQGKEVSLSRKNETSVHIVKAAKGYPGLFGEVVEKGVQIHSFGPSLEKTQLFFAGVKREGESLVTSGGRVLGVTSWAASKHEAKTLAYEAINSVKFEGEQYRSDIGSKL